METTLFVKGLFFGFSIAAPVGPIGILCIRRSMAGGWAAGLTTGLGAATADALYGCVAGFGLSAVSGLLVSQRAWMQLAGGLFLCWLGIRTLASASTHKTVGESRAAVAAGYLSALLLTLTNPMTILAFAAVFAAMGLGSVAAGRLAAPWLVSGVFCGSMAWWIVLTSIVSHFGRHLNATAMRWIDRGSGAVLTGFGLAAIVSWRMI
jgi:threonine/homoserine/homoserine lactone efflux protein